MSDWPERENREGVPHFKTGQHRAYVDPEEPDYAVLFFVNVMGWLVGMGCQRVEDGTWQPLINLGRWSANGLKRPTEEGSPPANFALTEPMLRALESPRDATDSSQVFSG